jgi:acyl-CoA thioester hydrolase
MQEAHLNAHRLAVKVYLEDTDAQGIVYHASYVRFFERGRSDFLEAMGPGGADLDRGGFGLVVHELRVKYRKPARLGDRLEVISTARLASPYRVTFTQRIERTGELLCNGTVEVVCIDGAGELLRIPAAVVALLG